MIISKDLFIFGEQIFSTIIPESSAVSIAADPQQTSVQLQEPLHLQQATSPVSASTAAEQATAVTNKLQKPYELQLLAKVKLDEEIAKNINKVGHQQQKRASYHESGVLAAQANGRPVFESREKKPQPSRRGATSVLSSSSSTDDSTQYGFEGEPLAGDCDCRIALSEQEPLVRSEEQPQVALAGDLQLQRPSGQEHLADGVATDSGEGDATMIRIPTSCCARSNSGQALAFQRQQKEANRTSDMLNVHTASQKDLSAGNTRLGHLASDEHATVTFPFIPEDHEHQHTLQLVFQNVNVLHNERQILSDVSGSVSPGEVLAIMGPSGCGKTTLLDCLSGQRHIDGGSIFLNQEPISKKWRRKIGYVLQEEVFFAGLTLRETVMYTALLRLPESMPKAEKVKLVDWILETLELKFCLQTKFGDYMNRGLSGGEKKRANIACELLTNPLLMLLDEPTSGLDSHSAISLMQVLKRYAVQEQKTIVISVHQPSSQMFHMFDKLLLLYNGRTAYFGEVNNIYRYFENVGVAIKPHYNPADFVLEQLKSYPDIREKLFVAAKESHCNLLNRNCITKNHRNMAAQHGSVEDLCSGHQRCSCEPQKRQQHDALINDIINNYYKDIHSKENKEEAAQQLWCSIDMQSNFSSNISSSVSSATSAQSTSDWLDYPTRFCTQFQVLSSRNFKEAIPRMLSKLNWFQTIGLALMAGAIWFQIPRTEEYLHDLQGWMFFSQTYWMLFALFGALNSFPSEREVISKERRSGSYRLSAYYLAKMFGELPLVVTLPTVYLMISYPMLGCTSFKLFFLMLVFLLLNTIVAQSVGFFIGACCMDMNVSITLSALYTLATQLFGGYLSSRIPEGLSWIRYTSMIHYAYQNMQILEFREGDPISCGNPSSYEVCKLPATATTDMPNGSAFIPYEDILRAQNSTSPLWLNTLILMMFFVVFRGLGYAVLRYVRCPKA